MSDLYDKYKDHPFYGRRILHVNSPVRWKSNKFLHHLDANYKVMDKTVNWLPMCHHYILVPPNNSIPNDRPNVTLIPFNYAGSVLFNRGWFNSKEFLNSIDFTKMDIDFIFNHQPELMYNVLNATMTDRYGGSTDSFIFFHWVDSPQSKPSGDFPDGFMRQLEAMNLATKTYFHCDASLDYLKSNFKKERPVLGINDNFCKDKISSFPLSADGFPEAVPFELPDKKILVFNHRWAKTTGVEKLVTYTKDLDEDWLIWITDRNAKKPKAGKPAPEAFKDHKCGLRIEGLQRGQYRYLIENCYATLCFVDKYMTWNLSVQDGIHLGTPTIVYDHPVQEYVVGKDYPYMFSNKKEFLEMVEKVDVDRDSYSWTLPEHDKTFKENLFKDMQEAINNKPKRDCGDGPKWLWHILQGNVYKKNILYNTHPNLYLSNVWEWIRLYCMERGIKDDPLSEYTKFFLPEDIKEDIIKELDGMDLGESKKNPSFTVSTDKIWFE